MYNMLTIELPFKIEMIQIIGFSLAILVSFFVTPVVRDRAVKLGLLDQPSERRIHKNPTPRLGGVAVFVSLLTITALSTHILEKKTPGIIDNFPIYGLLLGATIIFILGFLDDLEPVNSKLKLFIQIFASSLAWMLGVKILHIVNPLYHSNFGLFSLSIGDQLIHFTPVISYLATIIWIVGITNAINLVDGIDGLATGVSLISALAIWAVSVGQKIDEPVGALIAAILAGSLLGFLRWNFNPARIFLGDSGSYLTGFVLSSLTITCVMKSVTLAIMMPMLILIFAIPIIDTAMAIIRRVKRKKSILVPDREHLHHKILEAGLDQKRAVYVFYALSAGFGLIGTLWMSITSFYRFTFILSIVIFVFVFFALVINFKHQKIYKKWALTFSKKKKR